MPFRFAMRTEQDLEDGLDVSRADDGIDAERLHVLGWTDGEEVVR